MYKGVVVRSFQPCPAISSWIPA
uniref:Uncharacterized protein n=1 Tax=Arundo donax TaxID=35708 RepID=A0A0A9EKM6_ARUDO